MAKMQSFVYKTALLGQESHWTINDEEIHHVTKRKSVHWSDIREVQFLSSAYNGGASKGLKLLTNSGKIDTNSNNT